MTNVRVGGLDNCSRWPHLTPIPRSSRAIAVDALVLLAILLFFYRDIAFGGHTFLMLNTAAGTMPLSARGGAYGYPNPSTGFVNPVSVDSKAIAWVHEPNLRASGMALARGELPIWNRHIGLGAELFTDGNGAAFDPLNILVSLAPNTLWATAIDIQMLLRYFVAGFFTYLFACRLQLLRIPALLAGTAYMLASYFVAYGNHPQMRAETLLPLLIYCYDRLAERSSRAWLVSTTLTVTWCLLASFPESGFLVLALAGLWYGYRMLWMLIEARWQLRLAARLLFAGLMATILGIGLAAFFLMPLIARINESLHIHDSSIGLIALPWNLTLANVMPEVFPLADWTPHYYTVTLILGIMGCALSWRTRSNRRAILFFAVYGVIFYLKVYGFPLVSWIGLLPGYNQILLYKYPIPSISFCLAILAGFGLDRILRTSVPRWLFLLIPILVGGVVAGAWINPSGLVYDPAVLMRQSLLLAEITLLTCGLIYAVQLPRWKNLRYGVSMTLLVILVIEAANSSSWIVRPQRYDPYTIPPFVSYLNAHRSEPERIFGFDGIIIPELAAVYELDDIRFNSALLSIRRYLYIAQLLAPGEYPPTFLMHPGESVTTAWPDRIGQALSENRIQDRNGFIDNFSRLTGLEQPLYTGTYLDLLNVAKILTTDVRLPSNVINLLELPINREAIDASPRMSVQDLTITGDTRHGILISPPAQTMWSLIVPAGESQLRLGVGLNPAALKQIGSLGGRVAFRVTITDATGEHAVFSADLDSRQQAIAGHWIDQSIDLSQWSGQQIQLRLTATGDSAAGLAFWSAPIIQLENRPGPWVAERLRDMHEIQLLVPLLDQSAMRLGPALSGSHLMIDTTRYQTLAMQPENLAEVDVHLPDQPAALQFAIGADSANGIIDGVHYAVRVIDGTTDTLAFEYTLRPSILENDRHWISVSVDLTPWRGRAITLKLVTSGSSDRSHLAHWANPRIVGAGIAAANPNLARFRLEYDNEVQIYDNAYAYPRAFVVNQVDRVANIDQAIHQIVQPAFDPSLSAVVEAPAADVEQLERPTITTLATPAVHVIANTTDSITLQTRLTQPGWLVLSETYNPNWQATVDGKPATISPTNIFLQGVALTPGEHQIVFRYRSKELFLGMYVSLSVLLLLMIGLTIWWCLDRRREHRNG